MKLRRRAAAILLHLSCLPALALAQDDEEDVPRYAPGLVAEYQGNEGSRALRIDAEVAFAWEGAAPDERLAHGPFTATWRGRLFTIVPGAYRLHLFASGDVRVRLSNQVLAEGRAGDAAGPGWIDSPPIELEYGYHPLEIEYRRGIVGRIGLYWSGPQFPLEPVPVRHLFHEPSAAPGNEFEEGRMLARALRCGACHALPGGESPLAAADLSRLPGQIDRGWLIDWLSAPPAEQGPAIPAIERRMPHLGMSGSDAACIADYLTTGRPGDASTVASSDGPGDMAAGQRLFRTVGCLACHRAGSLGTAGLFGGGDLSAVAAKRPAAFFTQWLNDPAALNPAHRMPRFALSPRETSDLASYLSTLHGGAAAAEVINALPGDESPARQLVSRHRCASCHALNAKPANVDPPMVRSNFAGVADWNASCVARPDPARNRPGYMLPQKARDALRAYLTAVSRQTASVASVSPDGAFVLAERNCLACHERGESPGLAPLLPDVIALDPELTPLLPALSPPALIGVGDKLHDEALAAAITARDPPRRPWLAVRMPRFQLSNAERQAVVAHLVATDRIPDRPDVPHAAPNRPDELAFDVAGQRLVTADGFGCTSCHQIGQVTPEKVALNARGSDLSMLGRRVRRPWFDRWVRNPARIVPRMEMPSVQTPVSGVLSERLPDQLTAVWTVLNRPGFEPPPPNPIRTVRATGRPEDHEHAAILTDVLKAGPRTFINPLVIGLPNRHNVLFDLETNRLAGWWLGDTARQRTIGKSWHWEPGGVDVFPIADGPGEFVLLAGGRPQEPIVVGQFPTLLVSQRLSENGAHFTQRLLFDRGGNSPRAVDVKQWFAVDRTTAAEASDAEDDRSARWTGFSRRIQVEGLSDGQQMRIRIAPGEELVLVDEGRSLAPAADQPTWRIRLLESVAAEVDANHRMATITMAPPPGRRAAQCILRYETLLPLDQYVVPPQPAEVLSPARLEVAPGWQAMRLPLPASIMPTGLAWRADGAMAFTSLKGQVHLARDTDGDGLEDCLTTFADGLAAPYGLAADHNDLDVIHKPALVRLRDANGDGRAERSELLASGWGHTADYHDWAVGLPRDADGNYYVGLPCQQDDRTAAAAHLRGTVIKLAPRRPTPEDPRSFAIETLCAGLRFPMGLALTREGDLFATDNQGNYNPFNELNHLLPGQRYGFINKLEFRPDFNPPAQPAAVEIPHPLTRSVNGICVLETPAGLRKEVGVGRHLLQGGDLFGPFEGHLIGCEYDTSGLVRISLDRVGDTIQGAVYPFSVPPPGGAEVLEGPVVCAVAPNGDLVIGNLRDSGWGAGNNTGSIVRMRPAGDWPLGIAVVRAMSDGFALEFTGPVDRAAAERTEAYAIESFRRISTAAYGGPDADRRTERVQVAELSSDARGVRLRLAELRPGFVYELRLKPLGPDGTLFFPAEAYYTLRGAPR
jgi:mono/diheme cytochrome c family protein